MDDGAGHLASNFVSKTVPFRFRGAQLSFDLSHGLFSSAGVDVGTRLLLKVFSAELDSLAESAGPQPQLRVLDAGCGVGVIGICAASALSGLSSRLQERGPGVPARGPGAPARGFAVRCQDRDELARLFTLHNAAKNQVPSSVLEARAEPLLAGPKGERWDFILTNIPAKAGSSVLEDFVRRSAGLLAPGGRAIMVAVNTLAEFFRGQIALAGAELLSEQTGSGHTVFVYAAGGRLRPGSEFTEAAPVEAAPIWAGPGFLSRHPFYARTVADDKITDMPVRIETVHGASGFDEAGDAVTTAAKLALKIGPETLAPPGSRLLVHEGGQGFFICWLLDFLWDASAAGETPGVVLSGRNVLALEAARHNASKHRAMQNGSGPAVVPAADLCLGKAALLEAAGGNPYGGIVAFPELLPQSSLPKGSDQLAALWASVPPLLAPGGILLAVFGSSDAERFDRKKPAGFVRLGGIKRNGFRALAYRRAENR